MEVSTDNAAILADLKHKYTSIKDARIPFERQWYLNMAFYFGRQYVVWTSSGQAQKLWEPNTPSYRVKLVSNKCKSTVRTEVAKLLKDKPRGDVAPNTSEDSDRLAARGASHLYDAFEQPNAMFLPQARRQAVFWSSLLGNGFMKHTYDKNKKDFTGTKGALVVEAYSPFSLFVPDLLEPEIENQEYVIQESGKSIDWIKKTYNKDIKPDTSSSKTANTTSDQRFVMALGMNQRATDPSHVGVKEMWCKPCSDYPDGMWAIYTDDMILEIRNKWPYDHGQYPYAKLDANMTGRFYNDSLLVDFIPLQREYNKSISQLLESRNAVSRPHWVVQKGSINTKTVTNQPGQFIEYVTGMNPPQLVAAPPLPGYTAQLIDRIQNDMNDISSQHEITKGTTPTGVTAATAIAFLQEEDDSKLAPAVSSVEEATQKTASQLLSLVSQFWAAERMVKIAGTGSKFEVKAFKSSTLAGNTDYRVEKGSAMPKSRAARQALLLELHERQIITDGSQVLKYLDMAETGAMYDSTQNTVRQIEREHVIMQDQPVLLDVNDFDDQIAHIVDHQTFQRTSTYDSLPDLNKQAVDQHTMLHITHVASMYGRNDLIPTPLIDPATGQPIIDKMTGKPKLPPTNPALFGFIEAIKLHGPPPPQPPMQIGGPLIGASPIPGAPATELPAEPSPA